MKGEIKHRRLYAFYHSKVLNALMIVCVVMLLQIPYLNSFLMPVVCATTALALFISYSLWLWIKKPDRVVLNKWISNLGSWFTIYFLVVVTMNPQSPWWYIFPAVAAICALFISMVKSTDEVFEI